MAQGSVLKFEEFTKNIGDGSHDLDSDSFSLILITTLPVASTATPDRADFTEVTAGGGYSTGGIALTITYTEAAGTATFDATNNPEWVAAAGSPTNIVAGLIVNNTHSGSNDAIAFVDLTVDAGSTPVSLVDGNVKVTWNASGIFTVS